MWPTTQPLCDECWQLVTSKGGAPELAICKTDKANNSVKKKIVFWQVAKWLPVCFQSYQKAIHKIVDIKTKVNIYRSSATPDRGDVFFTTNLHHICWYHYKWPGANAKGEQIWKSIRTSATHYSNQDLLSSTRLAGGKMEEMEIFQYASGGAIFHI